MPRNSREPTLARQWELLKLIPRHRPGMTARELCERLKLAGHGVTKRTVERDLPELSIVFPLECNDVSMPYGWYWKADASFDIPGIALAEAVSLGLLEDLLRQLVPPIFVTALEGRFNAASDKLRSLPQNPYTKWTDLVRYVQPGLPFLPPAIKPGVLETVQEALLGRRQLRAVYLSAGANAPKERILHPLALIQQGARSYLLASSCDHDGLIQYALHRFQNAELLAKPAKIPKGFALDEFLAAGGAQFGQGATITLRATVTGELATILRETPIAPSQTLVTRDGTHTLTRMMTKSTSTTPTPSGPTRTATDSPTRRKFKPTTPTRTLQTPTTTGSTMARKFSPTTPARWLPTPTATASLTATRSSPASYHSTRWTSPRW